MKSAHRHELESNWLAHRLEAYIEQLRPYVSTILGMIVAIIVLMFIWSYWSGSSAARHSGSWDAFNLAIGAVPPDIDRLRTAAEQHPGSAMQQMADITWADGQVWMAAQNYIYNRSRANDALTRALSLYQGMLQSTDDKRLLNRARLGIARIYEMQNELDKARQQYLSVEGGLADYARQQAERLDRPETRETYAWLATAKPPLPKAPIGPGTPGQAPPFSAADLPLKGAAPGAPPATEPGAGADAAFQDILKNLQQEPVGGAERYPTDQPPGEPGDTGAPPVNPPADAPKTDAPPAEGAAPPAAEQPATETPSK
jgi:hypothetical protein